MNTKIDFASLKFNHAENISLTEKFLLDNCDLHSKIDKLVWAYHEIGNVIPQNIPKLFSGHVFPFNESIYEIECSYQLLKLAFYKYSFIALRNALELGLLSVYWDKNDNSESLIQNWHDSKEDTPFKRQIISGLKSIANINEFCNHFDLFSRLNKIYDDLSDYTHTKGYNYSAQNLNNANFTRFNEKVILEWLNLLECVIQLLLTIHILKYPVAIQHTPIQDKFGINGPFGGFLDVFQSEQIKEVLDPDEFAILKTISDNDDSAISLAEWVNSQPDLTEDELKEQINDFDKLLEDRNIKIKD
jgi:hypothetical protein